jgi:hypothetical protein
MLLILTSDEDLTADFLIVQLINRNLPYFRLNCEALATAGYTFAVTHDAVCRGIAVRERTVDLNEVRSVWYRRAIHPTPIIGLPHAEQAFVAGELRHLAMGLVLNPGIKWVNPIDSVSVAEHKILQLQIARDIGFRVPRTLISRDPAELRRFAERNLGGTICKPIFHGMFADGVDTYSIYTRRIKPDSFDMESVSACPVFLQEELHRHADVRATFIGRHCFAASITGDNELVDWRDPDLQIAYCAINLDSDVERMCREMLGRLGLVYGAFDFVRTSEGELVFLEVNPTGEWAWLENRLGFPMREGFIELFYGDHK